MKLEGLHVLFLIANGFEDLEFYVPLMRLQEEGARVTVAGLKVNEPLTGKNGLHTVSRTAISDSIAADYDGVVIPGGWSPDKLRRYDEVKQLIQDFNEAGKVIAMICHGGLVGISAGIVRGHQATGSEGIKDDLINAGAVWRDEPAFRSKNLIWGRVVADIPDFCRELVAVLDDNKRMK